MSTVIKNLHYGFTVSNLDRAVEFFRECIGLSVIERGRDDPAETAQFVGVPGGDNEHCVLQGHDHSIELMQYLGPEDRKELHGRPCDVGFSHLCYQVASLEEFIAKAVRFGVVPVNPPLDFPRYGCRGIYMRDSDGLTIEIIEKVGEPR
jgi:lactoylglutathione lyase